MKHSACITLCTAGRPAMLRRCLQSIVAQGPPANWDISLVVVENTASPECRDLVSDVTASTAMSIVYSVEERRGIPFARNHSMEKALATGAHWILFIDDDEVVAPGWLSAFCSAAETMDADIFVGPVRKDYPASTPTWYDCRENPAPATGTPVKHVYTNNTMMHADIVRSEGLAMRFNEAMQFTGGSDAEFFRRALDAGKVAVEVREAVVTEEVPDSRVTLRFYLQRTLRTKANRVRLYVVKKGNGRAYLRYGSQILYKLGQSLTQTLAGVVVYPFARSRGERNLVNGARALAEIGGYVMGLCNRMPQPYRRIDGC